MSFLQADCSHVDSPSRLLLNLLLIKKTCYYKNVPLLLCLSCKQTVHTSILRAVYSQVQHRTAIPSAGVA